MEGNYDRKSPLIITAIIAVAIAVVLLLIGVFVYLSYGYPYGYGGYYGGMMGGTGGVWMLFLIPIGLIVLIIIGYVIWRGFAWESGYYGGGHYRHYNSYGDRENAMEILRQRYARGEISKEQFEQMKKDIIS